MKARAHCPVCPCLPFGDHDAGACMSAAGLMLQCILLQRRVQASSDVAADASKKCELKVKLLKKTVNKQYELFINSGDEVCVPPGSISLATWPTLGVAFDYKLGGWCNCQEVCSAGGRAGRLGSVGGY
jgi:hypothetical protein